MTVKIPTYIELDYPFCHQYKAQITRNTIVHYIADCKGKYLDGSYKYFLEKHYQYILEDGSVDLQSQHFKDWCHEYFEKQAKWKCGLLAKEKK